MEMHEDTSDSLKDFLDNISELILDNKQLIYVSVLKAV